MPLTLFIYLPFTLNGDGLVVHWKAIVSEYILVVLTAVSGYVINDFFDRKQDLLANKNNFFNSPFRIFSYSLSIVIIAATIVCWWYQHPSKKVFLLLLAEAALLLLYSFPFIRLKETAIGLIADTLYSRIIPAAVLILLAVENTYEFETSFWVLLVAWLFFVGLRNILMHQLDDRKNDKKSNTDTVVIRIGAITTVRLMWPIILPLEISCLLMWGITCLSFSPILPYTFAGTCFVTLCYAIGIPSSNTLRQWKFRALYFPNHIYEEWLPVCVLVSYSCVHPKSFVFLFLHLLLFNKPWWKYIQLLRIFLSTLINYSIYHIFLWFNVDLVAEKTSAWQYIKGKLTAR